MGDEVGILKRVGDLLSPNDTELVEKTLARLTEQDTWNDVFSTKLIELLDKIDQVTMAANAQQGSIFARPLRLRMA